MKQIKRILVIDDSAFMRKAIKNILTRHGYTVVGEGTNGKDAVEKYKELSPDLVTMDITMDDMTGLDALREIRKYDSQARIIMVSAMGQQVIVREAITAGANGFLVKPFDEDLVLRTISAL